MPPRNWPITRNTYRSVIKSIEMAIIEPECHISGKSFSPMKLKRVIEDVDFRSTIEPGQIQAKGKWKGKASPYGSCVIRTPTAIENHLRIVWMADFIFAYKDAFYEAGASEVVYWLYWTGLQGNIELTAAELTKLSALELPLCIDYIQQS